MEKPKLPENTLIDGCGPQGRFGRAIFYIAIVLVSVGLIAPYLWLAYVIFTLPK